MTLRITRHKTVLAAGVPVRNGAAVTAWDNSQTGGIFTPPSPALYRIFTDAAHTITWPGSVAEYFPSGASEYVFLDAADIATVS